MDVGKDIIKQEHATGGAGGRRRNLRGMGNTEHSLQSLLTQEIHVQVATIAQHIEQTHARVNAAIDRISSSSSEGGEGNVASRLKKVHETLAEYQALYAKLDARVSEAEQSYRVLRFQFLRQVKSEWINVPAPQSQEMAMAVMPWDVVKRGKRRNAAVGAKKKKPRKKRAAKVLEGKIVTKESIAEEKKARYAAKRAPKDPKAPRPTVKRLKLEGEAEVKKE
jgi:hypothetical protein